MEKQYVGIDLHRRRSLIVRRDDTGTTHSMVRLDNSDLDGIVAEVHAAGPEPDVIVEATNGWYWLIDLLRAEGAHVHLAHPLGNNWGTTGEERRAGRDRPRRPLPPRTPRRVLRRAPGA